MNGPTEEDSNYIADCGFSQQEMADQVAAYRTTITQFNEAVAANGGFTWMMMDVRSPPLSRARDFFLAPRVYPLSHHRHHHHHHHHLSIPSLPSGAGRA